jgi:threonine/homoserine/homoserine lactone efflux protein
MARVLDLDQITASRESTMFLAATFRGAMQDGFSHSVAVVLGFALACAFSLFVVAAWSGLLH